MFVLGYLVVKVWLIDLERVGVLWVLVWFLVWIWFGSCLSKWRHMCWQRHFLGGKFIDSLLLIFGLFLMELFVGWWVQVVLLTLVVLYCVGGIGDFEALCEFGDGLWWWFIIVGR